MSDHSLKVFNHFLDVNTPLPEKSAIINPKVRMIDTLRNLGTILLDCQKYIASDIRKGDSATTCTIKYLEQIQLDCLTVVTTWNSNIARGAPSDTKLSSAIASDFRWNKKHLWLSLQETEAPTHLLIALEILAQTIMKQRIDVVKSGSIVSEIMMSYVENIKKEARSDGWGLKRATDIQKMISIHACCVDNIVTRLDHGDGWTPSMKSYLELSQCISSMLNCILTKDVPSYKTAREKFMTLSEGEEGEEFRHNFAYEYEYVPWKLYSHESQLLSAFQIHSCALYDHYTAMNGHLGIWATKL
jgi:hypothetical protein